MNRTLLLMIWLFGMILGAGIGGSIEHHFNTPVVVMSPICSTKKFNKGEENIPIIPPDSQDQNSL